MLDEVKEKYFLYQEGGELLLILKAPPEDFDDETIKVFWDDVESRGLKENIVGDIENLFKTAKRGDILHIGKAPPKGANDPKPEESDLKPPETPAQVEQPLQIEIQKDNISATLIIKETASSITEKQIREYLGSLGICHGVIDENVKAIVKKFPRQDKIKIAESTPPSRGKDAVIKAVKEIKTDLTPETQTDGKADFKKLNLISMVEVGETIQVRTPPTQGKPGKDIFGKEIPGIIGKDAFLRKGANTEICDNERTLIAAAHGFLYIDSNGVINVEAVYVIDGDLDYHFGHVEYNGDVIIKGDVRSGFDIFAGGNLQITGTVEDAVIHAKGNVEIAGGVRSSGEAVIKAEGDISVNFLQNALVEATGNITINRESINCRIKAGGNVEVLWSKGRIIGGSISASGWIAAPTLGSAMGNHLEVLLLPEGWEEKFGKAELIRGCEQEIANNPEMNVDEKKTALQELEERIARISTELDRVFSGSFVTAKSYLHPMDVRFGKFRHQITTDLSATTFKLEAFEVKLESVFLSEEERGRIQRTSEPQPAETEPVVG